MQHTCVAYPTMITPYESDGSVAYQTAARYVRWYYKNGCQGIFSICQSSEIAYLTLEERVRLNRIVYEETARIEKEEGKHMTVVSSGHTGFTLREQAYELNRIAESGTDALILITNRLDIENQGDDVWIKNAEKLDKLISYILSICVDTSIDCIWRGQSTYISEEFFYEIEEFNFEKPTFRYNLRWSLSELIRDIHMYQFHYSAPNDNTARHLGTYAGNAHYHSGHITVLTGHHG